MCFKRPAESLAGAFAGAMQRMIPFVRSVVSRTIRQRDRPLIDGAQRFSRICEAIEAAGSNVWAIVTFMWSTFEMPDGRGTALECSIEPPSGAKLQTRPLTLHASMKR